MKTGETYRKLFNDAGCLQLTAIRGYLGSLLSMKEKEAVDKHLAACPLCREAMEGFRQIPAPEKQEEIVDHLKAELYNELIGNEVDHYVATSQVMMEESVTYSGHEPSPSPLSPGRKKIPAWTLYAAAASVLLVAGYFAFFLPKPSHPFLSKSEPGAPAPSETILPAGPEKDSVPSVLAAAEIKTESKPEVAAQYEKGQVTEKMTEDVTGESTDQNGGIVAGIQVAVPVTMDTILVSIDEEEPAAQPEMARALEETERMKKEEDVRSKAAGAPTILKTQASIDQATPHDSVALFRHAAYVDFHDYITRNLTYPSRARRQGIEGTVTVRFVVDRQGNVKDVTITGSAHPLLDEEARRVIEKSPAWVPACKNDQPVETILTCPVSFSLK